MYYTLGDFFKQFKTFFMQKITMMGQDESCSHFRQLADGRWSGHNFLDVYVSVDIFEQGVQPERFKYLSCVKATDAQAKEHWDILRSEGYFQSWADFHEKEMAHFYGELY